MISATDHLSSAGATPRSGLVRVAQLELLLGNLSGVIVGTFATAVVMVMLTAGELGSVFLALWLSAVSLLSIVRVATSRAYRLSETEPCNVEQRQTVLQWLSFSNAALWGLFGFVAMGATSLFVMLTIVVAFAGLVASATAFLSQFRSMYSLYAYPLLLPMAAKLAWLGIGGVRDYFWIAALILIYLVVSQRTSAASGRSVLQSIQLRFENLDLVERLGEEKREAETARLRAEQASNAKSLFLGAASHDLRQPLHSLRMLTATLAARLRDRGERRLVEQIDNSVTSLDELFGAILELSQLDAGTLEVRKKHVSAASIFARLRQDFEPLAATRGIQLHVVEPERNLFVFSDAILLERLLRNLVSNATRYTAAGRVDVFAALADERVNIVVEDTGVGIAEEDRERIFEEFVQLGNPERDRSQGIGLGLSIVRRTADLLGLGLVLDSEPGRGSRFTVSVPAGVAHAEEDMPAAGRSCGTGVDGLFVVVIDDEASVREAIEGLLITWGCHVVAAGSAAEAVGVLAEIDEMPDVVLSDYRLRGQERGGAAIQTVREFAGRNTPGILITGDVMPERLRELAATGFPVLHKPCEPPELRQLLASLSRHTPAGHAPTRCLANAGERAV